MGLPTGSQVPVGGRWSIGGPEEEKKPLVVTAAPLASASPRHPLPLPWAALRLPLLASQPVSEPPSGGHLVATGQVWPGGRRPRPERRDVNG